MKKTCHKSPNLRAVGAGALSLLAFTALNIAGGHVAGAAPLRQDTTMARVDATYLEDDRWPLKSGQWAPRTTLPLCTYDPTASRNARMDLLPGQAVGRRATLVVFWAFWCDTWRDTTQSFNRMRPQLRAHGLVIRAVAVDASSQPVARPYYQHRRIWWPVLIDEKGAAGKAWGVRRVPTFFLVSRSGQVLRSWEGFPGQQTFWRETEGALAGIAKSPKQH